MQPQQPYSNDHTDLIPRTEFDGPALELDFPGLQIGTAEYEEGPTGCTVLYFPGRVRAVSDIRGGAHATIFSTELTNLDAVCMAGGSQLGLEASAGVADELLAMRGYSTHWQDIPLVAGAVIYDYGQRGNSIYPDKELGRAAMRAARPGRFLLGPRGAGRSATVGKTLTTAGYQGEPSGQGAAFRQIGPTKIAVFTVVNALGAVFDRSGRVVRGNRNTETGERVSFPEGLERTLGTKREAPPKGNTTLTVLVTNQVLQDPKGEAWALHQLAKVVHTSMARAIQPFHTIYDGDVLYAVTTNEVENPALEAVSLGALSSELAWDAVLSAVRLSPD